VANPIKLVPIFRLGAFLMLLGVGMGAFGAHAVRTRIEPEFYAVFQIGALYHLMHGLALCVLGTVERISPSARKVSAIYFAVGIVLFSGSLYALALTGITWLGIITPLGGICFMLGWFNLAIFGGKDK